MEILATIVVLAVGLLVATRFIGHRQEKVLGQYELLEKRFGFNRRTHKSRWGKGIKERFTLEGSFRGYPISTYSHYSDELGKRIEWTSLVLELLPAGKLTFEIEFHGSSDQAKFEGLGLDAPFPIEDGILFCSNREDAQELLSEGVRKRLAAFAKNENCGAFRLSKGFLEYREVGLMTSDDIRIRFQAALLVASDLADAVSMFVVENR